MNLRDEQRGKSGVLVPETQLKTDVAPNTRRLKSSTLPTVLGFRSKNVMLHFLLGAWGSVMIKTLRY
jgi:hypothetical protein